MAEGMNLGALFMAGWGPLDLRAAHLQDSTNPSSASGTRMAALGSVGGTAPWSTAAARLARFCWRILTHGAPAPAAGRTNYSARRPLRAAPTFPASRRYRLPPVSQRRDPARPRGAAAAAGKGGAAGGGRPRRRGGAGWPCRQPRSRPGPVRGSGVPAASLPRPVRSRRRGAAHEVKMVIRVFVASSSGSVAIKKRQQDVVRFLEANRIEFEEVDITMSEEKRQWMYKNIPEDRQPAQGNPLPPQIFSDDRYCGDYDGFFESKESNTVFSFLGLKPTLASKESEP
uniref:SH3 domain binding glutamate rich protein like 2 n=1 Tax=Otus sunia TaxID=257818 RepID=A0A8C8BQA4_9STRI